MALRTALEALRLAGVLLGLTAGLAALAAERPNVVLMLADDLGWGDLSIHGGTIPTPRLDRLFREGVRLDHFMAWCVCSPSRAMLLTGRHPFRVGSGPECGGELAREEHTIAEVFRAHGYRTGVFGKWHNGDAPDTPEFRAAWTEAFKDMPRKTFQGGLGVNEHGFDEAWVYYDGGVDHFTRRTVGGRGPVNWWHNREFRPNDQGYTDDLVTQHAMNFIREHRTQPFFCYVPFHLVHAPLQAKQEDLERVPAHITGAVQRIYAAMVMALDHNVGAILDLLDQLNLRTNTIVVFTSDNGATKTGSNSPFRGGKHTVFEGGTRMPTVIHWPAANLARRTWNGLCGMCDLLPTLVNMAGLTLPSTMQPLEGHDLWPALRDNAPSPVRSYYWVWRDEDAIRTAEWRLHRYFDRVELYHVQNDPGEARNVADSHPEVVAQLLAEMDAWAASLGAALSHRAPPRQLDRPAEPSGEVLEVTVTVTPQAKPRDQLVVPIARFDGEIRATDYVEFDLAVGRDSLRNGFFYAPFKGHGSSVQLLFRRGVGVDQFGREQVRGPGPQGGPLEWEHRVIGLCGLAPGNLGGHALVFNGGRPGTYRVYLDNLRIRRADGTVVPIWTDAQHTNSKRIPETEAFKNIRVRSILLSELTAHP